MNVNNINPFLSACSDILGQCANITFVKERLVIKHGMVPIQDVLISIGVHGDVKGNFFLSIPKDVAMKIVSAMMSGYPVTELDELSTSGLSELCNMICGTAGQYFEKENICIDITPPVVTVNMPTSMMNYKSQTISIPLALSIGGIIEMDISLN